MINSIIDFQPLAKKDISNKVLAVYTELYDVIKLVPLDRRTKFPKILRNNNFAPTIRITNTHAFLEISSKLQSKLDKDRHIAYKKIFNSGYSSEETMMHIAGKYIRLSSMTIVAPHAFQIDKDCSMCVWDITHKIDDFDKGENINVLYALAFGDKIRKEDASLEFDSLIRITFKDWSDAE